MEEQFLLNLFDVESLQYKNFSVEELPCSVRLQNLFKRNSVFTVGELLNKTTQEVTSWIGLGTREYDELITCLRKFFCEKEKRRGLSLTFSACITDAFKDFSTIDTSNVAFNQSQLHFIERYNELVTILDKEDLQRFGDNLKYCSVIAHALHTFSTAIDKNKDLEKIAKRIHPALLNMEVEKIVSIFTDDYKIRHELGDFSGSVETLNEYLKDRYLDMKDLPSFKRLLEWLTMDTYKVTDDFIQSGPLREREFFVLIERSKGLTLEQVGDECQVTRERIRQIEEKAFRKLDVWEWKKEILSYLQVNYIGKGVIFKQDLDTLFGKYSDLIGYYLKSTKDSRVRYEKRYDSFVVVDLQTTNKVLEFVNSLSDSFNENEIVEFPEKLPCELIWSELNLQFEKIGDVYHRSRLTLTKIYEDVLKKDFPNGLHVYDSKEIENFKNKIEERYGKVKTSTSERALAVRIAEVGVLCNRGTYKAKQENYISKELANQIYIYIENSRAPAILTNILYAVFKTGLQKENVNNKYYLQGILKELYGDRLTFRRDYIVKDLNYTNISSSVVRYVIDARRLVSKREIFNEFPGITEIVVSLALTDERIINLFGQYISGKMLTISEEDKDYLSNKICEHVQSKRSVHCKTIYEEVLQENRNLLTRNYIMQPFGMYSLLEYLFRDDYSFSRPMVAEKGVDIEKTIDSLYMYVNENTLVDLEDIKSIAREKHFQINSLLAFVNDCNETHYLISNHQIAAIEYLGIEETDINSIENAILDSIDGTIPICQLKCANRFPNINIKWNEWMVYSLINKLSSKLEVGMSSNKLRHAFPLIAPRGMYDDEKYRDLNPSSYSGMQIVDDLNKIDELVEDFWDES